jgi:hypothetical protein
MLRPASRIGHSTEGTADHRTGRFFAVLLTGSVPVSRTGQAYDWPTSLYRLVDQWYDWLLPLKPFCLMDSTDWTSTLPVSRLSQSMYWSASQ